MSSSAMHVAQTGLTSQQYKLQVIANNLSNVNTTGFKRERANFQTQLYQTLSQSGGAEASAGAAPKQRRSGSAEAKSAAARRSARQQDEEEQLAQQRRPRRKVLHRRIEPAPESGATRGSSRQVSRLRRSSPQPPALLHLVELESCRRTKATHAVGVR